MTDTPNTNPDANTIMVLSITTASGPRSIITNTLRLGDANLIAATLQAAGHHAEVRPMGAVYSLARHLQKQKAKRTRADTRALEAMRASRHKQLENELAEEAMSRELVSKRTAHRRDSQRFRDTGDTEHPPP
jgi:hypothetical protein